jgi:2-polyprenyl-6-methoxyphenol hydroxylase-like FAD-dependent oxidoreductase
MRGRDILDSLFPGFSEEMVDREVPFADAMADFKRLLPNGWGPRFESGSHLMMVSRNFLEWRIRERVTALPSVEILEGATVRGLWHEAGEVTGVRYDRGHDTADQLIANVDLVVDASGRGSAAPKWLGVLGYPTPQETTVNGFFGYASRFYRLRPGFTPEWVLLATLPNLAFGTRGGGISKQEGGRVICTVFGAAKDYPPSDEAGYEAFLKTLDTLELAEAMEGAEPLSDIHINHSTANRIRHYERLQRRPERFIVVGDAACAFNPVYGQGMATALMGAELLNKELTTWRGGNSSLRGFSRHFQKRLAKMNQFPWIISTGQDYRLPISVGAKQPVSARLLMPYADRLAKLSDHEPALATKLNETIHLIRSPLWMVSPTVVFSVLRRWRRLAPKYEPPEVLRDRPGLDLRTRPVYGMSQPSA